MVIQISRATMTRRHCNCLAGTSLPLQHLALSLALHKCSPAELSALCRYSKGVRDYNKAYEAAKAAIISKFYGPPTKGVYSPSVQYTLYQMAVEMLAK